ncbi:MAG: hypothetical protein AAF387_22100, partial [Pseudomonadota bacterium]
VSKAIAARVATNASFAKPNPSINGTNSIPGPIAMNSMQKAREEEEAEAPPEPSAEETLLTEIRDLLKK